MSKVAQEAKITAICQNIRYSVSSHTEKLSTSWANKTRRCLRLENLNRFTWIHCSRFGTELIWAAVRRTFWILRCPVSGGGVKLAKVVMVKMRIRKSTRRWSWNVKNVVKVRFFHLLFCFVNCLLTFCQRVLPLIIVRLLCSSSVMFATKHHTTRNWGFFKVLKVFDSCDDHTNWTL